jgi:ABC-type transporter Mla MlaB component
MPARRSEREPETIVLALGGRIARADIPRLCERFGALLEVARPDHVRCDVAGLVDCDAVTVDALARIQLRARRAGCQIRLCRASDYLRGLIEMMGLSAVVPCVPDSALEPVGQPEQREPPRRVQKEGDAAEPIARDVEDLQ